MATPIDTYAIHAPTKAGKPRRLHPAQVVKAPTPEGLHQSGHADRYSVQALDTIRHTLAADPHATHTRHDLPNRNQEGPAARELIAEHLHPLGALVGPLQRTRGTRQPFAVITWPAGWTVPENQTGSGKATPAEAGEENHDDAQDSC